MPLLLLYSPFDTHEDHSLSCAHYATRHTADSNLSVGECIAWFAAHPPAEKVTMVDNDKIVETAKKWRQENEKK